MSDALFLQTLRQINTGACAIKDLIEAAAALNAEGRSEASRELYKVWAKLNPKDPHVHVALFNCAVLESEAGQYPTAAELLKQAIGGAQDFLPAYINLGSVLERGGAADQAIETWKAMLGRIPSVTGDTLEMKITGLKQIGRVFSDHHQPAMCEVALKECLELLPEQRDVIEQYVAMRMGQCEWPVMATSERVTRKILMNGISPLSASAYADDPILHLASAVRFVEQAVEDPDDNPYDRRDAEIDLSGRRLRIGYVSSDLRDHAIGYLMAELFELHDRGHVEVFAYYCGKPDDGALNQRIKAAVEHWVDIREMSDEAAAARICADGIDILVDVNGHTRDARSALFARRPAPIIVNWLGYPGTMGTPYHQYIVADDYIIPPGAEGFYVEKVLRLPCYQPNDRKRAVAEPRPTRADYGLPRDAFVFCSFNGSQKLTHFNYLRWLEIMRAVPNSVLWMLDPLPDTFQRLQDFAELNGVARERLVSAPKIANPYHLARYPLADLFLDSFPYGGHTTASDALWMGVPVLTMSGLSFASRVCGSLVRAAGLPELVTETPQDYVRRAIELAREPATVAALKAKLEMNRPSCDLFNMEKLVSSLEGLFDGMVADYLQGELRAPDLINCGVYLKAASEFDHDAQEMLSLSPDYRAAYLAKLAKRHRARPIPPDSRLWTPEVIAEVEGRTVVEPERKKRAAAR